MPHPPNWTPGRWVRINTGAFESFEGFIKEVDDVAQAAIVIVDIFGAESAVEVAIGDLSELRATHILGNRRDVSPKLQRRLLKQLSTFTKCPYCGGDIGGFPFADHIYPASKGGLSKIENMILVCESCYLSKNGMTLRQFIKTAQLRRSTVEARLEKLRKVF